ncbi:uncharacterized protein LOC114527159 [Dendronephthya gigantea]|uniref:uncharacterized protein LOC114527159 n=1 Tax=Dendronephthya gigantea TaxID=151771 RepID=UPI00106ADC55|nr:uncharacterized protein LOC114527159 [Dendronephthya gigantea]
MLSIVLLFGFIETVSGNSTIIHPSVAARSKSSSSLTFIYITRVTTSTSFINSSVINQLEGNGSRIQQAKNTSMTTQFLSPTTSTQIQKTETMTRTSDKYNSRSAIIAAQISRHSSSAKMTKKMTISSDPTNFIPSSTAAEKSRHTVTSIVPGSSRARLKTTPTAKTCTNKEKVFGLHVKPATLVDVFYGTFAVALSCIIILIIVCCCWKRQMKTQKQRQNTTLFNPYANHVVGFPSPLQLDTFKPESPYDTPELLDSLPDVSYVTVVDGNESDPQYAAVKNGTVQSLGDGESRDEPQPSPAYTNASVFQIEPYQELMANNRVNEDHYTSLIKTDKNEKNEDDVSV